MDVEKMRLLPDKPKRGNPTVLKMMKSDKHMALTKYDGWSILIEITKYNINFISRLNNVIKTREQIADKIRQLNLPINTTLWGEWMCRRPDYDGPECIVLFSPIFINGEFVGGQPFIKRFNWLCNLEIPFDDSNIKDSNKMPDCPILLPIHNDSDFVGFFELQKTLPRSEGVVVYKKDGQFYGNPYNSMDSPDMTKIQYRTGP